MSEQFRMENPQVDPQPSVPLEPGQPTQVSPAPQPKDEKPPVLFTVAACFSMMVLALAFAVSLIMCAGSSTNLW